MFVKTFNIGKALKASKVIIKLMSTLLVLVISFYGGAYLFFNSDSYVAAISEATEKKTIIIDAGHGGEDCGAIGVSGIYEKDLNLEISTTLGDILAENGYAVVYTRTEDKLLYAEEENIKGIRKISDLKNRCKIGAEYPSSIFISVHMNSFGDSKYSGLQVYYGLKDGGSLRLAQAVQNSVKSELQESNKRVVKPGENMYILENLENTAILIECGFLSNPEECEKLSQKEYQKQLCFSICCGIIEYMKTSSDN